MRHLQQMGSDVARALVVLALLFLSFAHAPATPTSLRGDVLTAIVDTSFCGGLPSDDGKAGHAPCHACRIGATDVPAPACTVIAAPVAVTQVAYAYPAPVAGSASTHDSARPRAPPALV